MSKTVSGARHSAPLTSKDLARTLERVAWLMDRAVKIPGTRTTFGLDAVLGLLPVGGDVLTGIVQAGLVLVALKHYRVPKAVAARMAANVLLDVGVGMIPILGDLFDVVFKANTRNLKLLEPYRPRDEIDVTPVEPAGRPKVLTVDLAPGGTPLRYLLPIALVLLTALALVVIGFVAVVRWLLS